MKEYDDMKQQDAAQLKQIAREYEKFMYFKVTTEKEMQKS